MVEDLESVPLLVAADLPAGWQMPDPSLIDPGHDSTQIDQALRYEQWVDPAPGLDRKLRSGHNNNDSGRWFLIQHTESNTRVLLRLQRQYLLGEEPKGEVRITGIVHLPEWAGDSVASPMLRNLPTSRIEAAINRRQFAVTGQSRFEGGTMTMPSGRVLRSADVMKPLGNPKRTPDFYEVVALQHARLVDDGEPNPTARMAEISRVPLSTAQGWVARARRKGLLPPGRRGRAG
ncbi:hypothetical protein M3G00_01750 [Brevibacterium casei]|uniref:Uncharacterized protein n=2 Tax=Brevibacterium casei TaxID=33889 RepID=K9AR24_9MICO|nr:hypothetical protein [Brevibacterium casei]NJE65815.1 hypothetical protein [Brevibacterium sp. LS14]EKU48471.1 hypothetical protein C272_06164 [Brevibacterium casei S18]KZE12286.1 hypothetical protein AVW13_16300 [Brevibacterium casei]MCT2181655.1 hypothetical protein [Brevibacterium casei]QQT69968.1 hypothetical protein I6I57_03325 [Brevibacterium casei]